jgi:hypothetical protein
MEINEGPVAKPEPLIDWKMPYLNWLLHELLSDDKTEAQRLTCRAKSFTIIEGEIYRRSHTKVLQRCILVK